MKSNAIRWASLGLALIGMTTAGVVSARADDGSVDLKSRYQKALEGKTIAFLPMSLGAPLMDTWEYVIRTEAARNDMKYIVKDPNWNSTAQAQAFEAIISEKPDVI